MVKKRNCILVVLLSIVTCGLYTLYWMVSTKREMVDLGADIPTAWLIIIPIADVYFTWKHSKGVENISDGSMSGVLVFILWIVFFPAAVFITQTELNKHASEVNEPTSEVNKPISV